MTRYRCVMLRRSGATEIRIVRAEDEAGARATLAAAGLDPVSVEAIGPSLFDALGERVKAGGWRLPVLRVRPPTGLNLPPRPMLIAAGLILATIPVTTAIGGWGLAGVTRWQAHRLAQAAAPALDRYRRIAAVERARPRAAAIMAAPTLSELAVRLAAVLPDDAGLAGLSRDEGGALLIEVETSDPDRLRTALAADPLLGSLHETGQTMTDGATIKVALQGRI